MNNNPYSYERPSLIFLLHHHCLLLEVLHRAADLPHRHVSRPNLCSHTVTGRTVLQEGSPQGCRSPSLSCQQAKFVLSHCDGSDSPAGSVPLSLAMYRSGTHKFLPKSHAEMWWTVNGAWVLRVQFSVMPWLLGPLWRAGSSCPCCGMLEVLTTTTTTDLTPHQLPFTYNYHLYLKTTTNRQSTVVSGSVTQRLLYAS